MATETKLWNSRFCRVWLYAALCALTMSISNTALPLYVVNFLGLSATQSGLLGTVFTIASCACRIFNGGLCDRVGWRRMMIAGAVIVGLALTCMGFTTAFFLILVLKAMQGVGHSINSTASNAAAASCLPKERISEGMGHYTLHSTLVNAVGPILTLSLMGVAVVSGSQNYSLPLYVGGACGVAATLLALSLREDRSPGQQARRARVTVRDLIEPSALAPAALQCIQSISVGASIYMILFANYMGFASVGYYFIVSALVALAVRALVGKRTDRVRPVFLSAAPTVVMAACYLLLAVTQSEAAFMITAVGSGVYNALLGPTYNSLALKLTRPSRAGAASSTYWLGFDLGMAIGQIVFGMIIDTAGGDNYKLSFLVAGIYLLVFVVGAFFVLRRYPPLREIKQPEG